MGEINQGIPMSDDEEMKDMSQQITTKSYKDPKAIYPHKKH